MITTLALNVFIVIGAVLTPITLAAERNSLEHRTKFIIYDNKYENYQTHLNSD